MFLSQFNLIFTIKSTGDVVSNFSGELRFCKGEIKLNVRGDIFGKSVLQGLYANDQHLILNSTAPTRAIYLLEAIIIGFVRMGLFHNVVRLSGDHNPARADAGIEDLGKHSRSGPKWR